MTCGWNVKNKTIHWFITVLLIYHKLPSIDRYLPPWSLPDHSLIYPPTSPWYVEDVLLKSFLDSEAEILNPPSKIAFTDPVPYSVNEISKTFLTEDTSGWPCRSNPQNVLPHIQSPEIPHCINKTSQRKNGTNFHFQLGIISTDDPPDSHYKPLPKYLYPDTTLIAASLGERGVNTNTSIGTTILSPNMDDITQKKPI